MDAYQTLNIVLSVIQLFLIIPRLWVAGRLLPKLVDWVRSPALRGQLSRPLIRVILWLALGTLFTFPLLDLMGLVGSLPAFVGSVSSGSFATAFGTVPGNSVTLFSTALMLLIYLGVWWAMRRIIAQPEGLDGVEWTFLVLLVASLIYRFVSRGVIGFLQLPLPNAASFFGNLGVGGFVLAVVVALALLAVIVVGMNMALANRPMDDER